MALRAGRVGVNPSEVDTNGKIKQSGGDYYTKEETNAEINKVANDIDIRYNNETGLPEWKERGADTFNPFSSGSSIEDYTKEETIRANTYTCNKDYGDSIVIVNTYQYDDMPLTLNGQAVSPIFTKYPTANGNCGLSMFHIEDLKNNDVLTFSSVIYNDRVSITILYK